MQYKMRPIRKPDDFARIADLINTVAPEKVDAAKVQEWEDKIPDGLIREWLGAVDANDRLIASAISDRTPWMNPGKFEVDVVVDPACHKQGIGATLLDHVEGWAREQGATLLEASVRDHLPQALAFVQKRGYEIDRHLFESTLDVPAFDENRFAGVVEAAEAGGIRFFTLADAPGEATERRLYELTKETMKDIPGWDEEQFAPFEQWRKWALTGPEVRPECIMIAAEGDRFAGVTDMKHMKESGAMWTHYTAVHRDFRGRQLALALKLLAVRAAKRYGAPYMRTNNDSKNAPMLAVNRKMGYVPCPGQYRLRKKLV